MNKLKGGGVFDREATLQPEVTSFHDITALEFTRGNSRRVGRPVRLVESANIVMVVVLRVDDLGAHCERRIAFILLGDVHCMDTVNVIHQPIRARLCQVLFPRDPTVVFTPVLQFLSQDEPAVRRTQMKDNATSREITCEGLAHKMYNGVDDLKNYINSAVKNIKNITSMTWRKVMYF